MAEQGESRIDTDRVAALCADLIRFDTTNRGEGDANGEREAAEYVAAELEKAGLVPTTLESAPRRTNVVARMPGTDPSLPALLVQGHLDVVPANPAEWTFPPFSGEVRDGYVHGRGATDMKDFVAMTLGVLHRWAEQGRGPRRDVVFAFVADEETTGSYGAHWLVENHPGLFDGCVASISESGAYTTHATAADGRPVRIYPVGTAERGTAHVLLTATGRAGHGSRRNDDNAVVRLARALVRIADHKWPVTLSPTVERCIVGTGAALGVPVDLSSDDAVDATVAAFGSASKLVENTIRNSTTPTMLDAGLKVNIIPGTARAQVDIRVLPGTEEQLLDELDRLLGPSISRTFVANQPPVQAPLDTEWFDAMAAALVAEDPEAVVVPYCLGGGTDAKAFSRLGMACYGFNPLWIPPEFDYRSAAHGIDERVPVAALAFGTNVLDRFLSTC
jgi:acetylornithine deacetylase/succinyl-diaminopimelate desuccinylase-like protein